MAQQSKKNSPVGRGQEEQLPSILASVQGTEANSEASSGVGSPIEERQYISKCKIGFLLYPVLLTDCLTRALCGASLGEKYNALF